MSGASGPRTCGITVILRAIPLRRSEKQATKGEPQTGDWLRRGTEIFLRPYYLDQRSDLPEQYRAIGWVGQRLYTVILEMREDEAGEFYHLVTLWKATRQEQELYEEHS